jgi:hypothetical protein
MEEAKRVSLTKSQCATETGRELITLCLDFTNDGILSEDEIQRLQQWITKSIDSEIAAIPCLNDAIMHYFDSTSNEYKNKKALYSAIESVLPVAERKTISNNRKTLETEEKSSTQRESGSRYFCESLFWASQPKQAAKT